MNNYFYYIKNLKIKPWIKFWLLNKKIISHFLSNIETGTSFNLTNTDENKFNLFEIYGNSVQDGTPTPAEPIKIQNCGELINLLNQASVEQRTKNGITCELTNDGIYLHGTASAYTGFEIPFETVEGTNTYSCDNWGGFTVYGQYNGSSKFLATKNTTYTGFINNLVIGISTGTEIDKVINFQVEKGSQATQYKPYGYNNISIEISDNENFQLLKILAQQPMRAIGDVKDTFVKISGTWYERHNIGHTIIDGSSDFYNGGSTGTNAYYLVTNVIGLSDNTKATAYSDMFRPCSFNDRANGLDIIYSQDGTLCLRTANNTSIDWSDNTKRKNWLSSNNVDVIYIASTPTDIECTEEQVTELEKIKDLYTYENTTNIISPDITPPYLRIQYWKNNR